MVGIGAGEVEVAEVGIVGFGSRLVVAVAAEVVGIVIGVGVVAGADSGRN